VEQQILRLVIGAEDPVGDRQAEEAGDRFVGADVRVVEVMEAIDLSPQLAEARMAGCTLPPRVRQMFDRVQHFVGGHRPCDRGIAAEVDRRVR
jgi:hypothetical protein